MAKLFGVTEGTIRRKFNRLTKQGIIKTTAICDPYALGFDAPAFVGIRAVQNKAKNLAKEIAEMPEVQLMVLHLPEVWITMRLRMYYVASLIVEK
jgi:Lrp/AsnC family transcriptional regulator for asnA, asnC and gidA